jgi:uncharacterized membrane protein
MQLSDTDKKLVARLKKSQQQFIRWRWVGLFAAILCIGIGIYAFVILQQFAQEPALPSVMAIAFLSPVVYLLQVSGFGLLIYLVTFWRGKPEVDLLLRLMEDSQDDA